MAGTYAYLGEHELAIDWVETSVRLGNTNYPLLFEHDPFLWGLHDEPRYQALMQSVESTWRAFAGSDSP